MPTPVFGSITENTSSADRSGTTVNTTHDVGSGSDRTVVCVTMARTPTDGSDPNTTAVTYNSVALTERASVSFNAGSNDWFRIEEWTLDNPASGSNTGAVTYDSTELNADAIFWYHYTGANNGVGQNGSSTGSGTGLTTTFTTDESTSIITGGGVVFGNEGNPFSPGGGETERADGNTGGDEQSDLSFTIMDSAATGGSDTFSTTASANEEWAILAVEILEAAAVAAGGVYPSPRRYPQRNPLLRL